MSTFPFLRGALLNGENLSPDAVVAMVGGMLSGSFDEAQTACLLTLLNVKGETTEELSAALQFLRGRVEPIGTDLPIIDTCGTGGDGAGTFNISTAVALVLAACGVPVAKHGNRKVSSGSGSVDVLECLGVRLPELRDTALRLLEVTGFTFLFAPLFHPALARVGAVRKSLAMPTAFNLFGPFLNPCFPKRQVVGVARPDIAAKLALVALDLDYEHLAILASMDGLDEASIASETVMYEIREGRLSKTLLRPEDVGLQRTNLDSLKVGDPKASADVIRDVFSGRESPAGDIVVLNVGIALYVAGKVSEISSAVRLAEEALRSGAAQQKLEEIIQASSPI
jgi:anthranilate phosphoribosyltransferase